MSHITNALTVRELREMLANYHDDMSVMVAPMKGASAKTIKGVVEMGIKSVNGEVELCVPTDKNRPVTFAGIVI